MQTGQIENVLVFTADNLTFLIVEKQFFYENAFYTYILILTLLNCEQFIEKYYVIARFSATKNCKGKITILTQTPNIRTAPK